MLPLGGKARSAKGVPISNTALFLVPALIWGSTWHAIPWQLGTVAEEVSVTYRFAAAALLLALGCVATRRSLRFSRRDHAFLFLPELRAAGRGGSMAFGIALVLAAVVACAAGNLIAVRNHNAGIPTIPGTAWAMAYGMLFAAAVAWFNGAAWTFDARPGYVLSVAYLPVFGSVCGKSRQRGEHDGQQEEESLHGSGGNFSPRHLS